MKRTSQLLCAAVLIAFGTISFAQQPTTPPEQSPAQQPPVTGRPADPSTGSRHMKTKSTTGTIKAYEPGKSVEVATKAGDRTYDLAATDMTVTVSPDVKVGSKVKVVEKADSSGKKAVNIEPHGSGTH